MKLAKVIQIEEANCVNCHQCLSVCPMKFANNGADDVIHINYELCIGCGMCLKACTHNARIPVDDFDIAMKDLSQRNQKIVAIVAPAVGSNFPDTYLRLNGWLKSIGVEAFFDVSFGAELTVKTYLEHVKANNPKAVIAQPCPAIVTYIQIYQPSLIPYLAPADSPMVHTMKMVRRFYPQYKDHKLMVISPCISKRREFDETGFGDYNVTISRIIKHLDDNGIMLKNFPEVKFDNESAERAVLFSTPGGLLETAERELPGIRNVTRKIEGGYTIYHYLKQLDESIQKGVNPLVIDCLNCELGCNGGTGTTKTADEHDELEFNVNKRKNEMLKSLNTENNNKEALEKFRATIDKYWEKDLYNRTYIDHSENYRKQVKTPSESQMTEILHSMYKFEDADIRNCASCGYNNCKDMARAIFNGYNRKENCHFFLDHKIKELNEELNLKVEERTNELINNSEELLDAMQKLKNLIAN